MSIGPWEGVEVLSTRYLLSNNLSNWPEPLLTWDPLFELRKNGTFSNWTDARSFSMTMKCHHVNSFFSATRLDVAEENKKICINKSSRFRSSRISENKITNFVINSASASEYQVLPIKMGQTGGRTDNVITRLGRRDSWFTMFNCSLFNHRCWFNYIWKFSPRIMGARRGGGGPCPPGIWNKITELWLSTCNWQWHLNVFS